MDLLLNAAQLMDSTPKPKPGSLEELKENLPFKVLSLLSHETPLYQQRALTFYKHATEQSLSLTQPTVTTTTTTSTEQLLKERALSAVLVGACSPFTRGGLRLTSVTEAAGVSLAAAVAPLHAFIALLSSGLSGVIQGSVLCEARHFEAQLGGVWRHFVRCSEAAGLWRRLCEVTGASALRSELCWLAFLVSHRENRAAARVLSDANKYFVAAAAYYFLCDRDFAKYLRPLELNEGHITLVRRQYYQTCAAFGPDIQKFFSTNNNNSNNHNSSSSNSGGTVAVSSSSFGKELTYEAMLVELREVYNQKAPRDFDESLFATAPLALGTPSLVPQDVSSACTTAAAAAAMLGSGSASATILRSPMASPMVFTTTATVNTNSSGSSSTSTTPLIQRITTIPRTPNLGIGTLGTIQPQSQQSQQPPPPPPPLTPIQQQQQQQQQQQSQSLPPGTPMRATFAAMSWVASFAGVAQGPGCVLRSLAELYGAEEHLWRVTSLVSQLAHSQPRNAAFCEPDKSYSSLREHAASRDPGMRTLLCGDAGARLAIAEKIFYYLFDGLLSREFYTQDAATSTNAVVAESSMEARAQRFAAVLSRELLVRSILAFAVETVGHAVKAGAAVFPAVLRAFAVPPFEFFRISMNIAALGAALPSEIAGHFRAAEEAIVDNYAWERGSRVLDFYADAPPLEILEIALTTVPIPQEKPSTSQSLLTLTLTANEFASVFNGINTGENCVKKEGVVGVGSGEGTMHHGFAVLLRKFFRTAARKLEIFENTRREQQTAAYRVWLVFALLVAGCKWLLRHRQGTQLLLCAMYACSIVGDNNDGNSEGLIRMAEFVSTQRNIYENVEVDPDSGTCAPLNVFYEKIFAPAVKPFVEAAVAKLPLVQQQQQQQQQGHLYTTPFRGVRLIHHSTPNHHNFSGTQRLDITNTPMKSKNRSRLVAPQQQQQQQQQHEIKGITIRPPPLPPPPQQLLQSQYQTSTLADQQGLLPPQTPPQRPVVPLGRGDDFSMSLFSPTPGRKQIKSKNGPIGLCSPGLSTTVNVNTSDPLMLEGDLPTKMLKIDTAVGNSNCNINDNNASNNHTSNIALHKH